MATIHRNLSRLDPQLPSAADMKFGIVVSQWNPQITGALLEGAVRTLRAAGCEEQNIIVKEVPGTFELALGAQYFAEYTDVDGVIVLGCVIQGETRHFDYVCQGVTQGVTQLMLSSNMPVAFGVLTTENSMTENGDKEQKHTVIGGDVEFDGVELTYPEAGAPSLSGVNFYAPSGSTVGVIGGTGSGKTSLVNLIPRFYDVTKGCVKVGGTDVQKLDAKTLRKNIGIVPQRAALFKGTIRSNLLWGKEDATDEELWEALKTAQAEKVALDKGGLDAEVEQEGRNFSGGQRQRLTVARALVRKPKILILDDSASALDLKTDAALREAISKLDYKPTVFIVSQRAAAVMNAQLIVVLDEGAVVGLGTHEELMKTCPAYEEIYSSQFKKEADR